jgi:hypothetical protein
MNKVHYLHRMAAARPVREQGRPPSSAPVLSPVPVDKLRAMFAERSFAERFDGPPRNVVVKPSLRFRAAVTLGLAIVSWAVIAISYCLIASGVL